MNYTVTSSGLLYNEVFIRIKNIKYTHRQWFFQQLSRSTVFIKIIIAQE